MFIAFFLSHGEEGKLITRDSDSISFHRILEPFTNSRCEILKGKPKLFFFACCLGKEDNIGFFIAIICPLNEIGL